ncbi:N-substituted formamide deformylase precursor [compost metagenome]
MCQACVGKLIGRISASHIARSFDIGGVAERPEASTGADPTVIFYNGDIITLAGERPDYPEALAISGESGVITAVGTLGAVRYKFPSAALYDLQKRTLMPGFIDPHQHTLTGSVLTSPDFFTECGYDTCPDKSAVKNYIMKVAANGKKGEWLMFSLYDNLLQGGNLTMAELSAWAPDNPVFVYYINIHTATGNEKAFAAAGVNPDPAYYDDHPFPDGGHLGLSNGKGGYGQYANYDGMIYEEGAVKFFLTPALKGRFNETNMVAAVRAWSEQNVQCGNTTIHEAGIIHHSGGDIGAFLSRYAGLMSHLSCRTSASLMYEDVAPLSLPQAQALYAAYGSDQEGAATQKPLMLHGIKIVADGSNQAMTAYQTQAYLGDAKNFGSPNYQGVADLTSQVETCASLHLPVLIHCNGDKALDDALEAIKAAYGPDEGAQARYGINRIEHCTITRPEQIQDMSQLGIQPSFLMNHVYYYGLQYQQQLFGDERTARMDAACDCLQLGLPFSLHTDAPCSNIGALQLVHVAVNRTYEENNQPGQKSTSPTQKIPVYEALRAVTLTAARHIGLDKHIGSLEEGKFADLVILGSNPLKVEHDKIIGIEVYETWVGGARVYQK